MSIVTFDRVPSGSARASVAPAANRTGFWRRAFDRFVEARQRQAMNKILRYHHFVLPRELEDAGCGISGGGEDSLPFVR
jgi:hypothetical protein